MNTLIIYSSKYGCTEDCAKQLKSSMSGSVSLADADNTSLSSVRLESYDTIIMGSSIYIGSISKKIRAFCKEKEDILSRKRVGIFLCCAFQEQLDEYLSSNFPSALLQKAVVVKSFGGEARVEKMKTLDKIIMKAAMKERNHSLTLLHKNIDSFLEAIQA